MYKFLFGIHIFKFMDFNVSILNLGERVYVNVFDYQKTCLCHSLIINVYINVLFTKNLDLKKYIYGILSY